MSCPHPFFFHLRIHKSTFLVLVFAFENKRVLHDLANLKIYHFIRLHYPYTCIHEHTYHRMPLLYLHVVIVCKIAHKEVSNFNLFIFLRYLALRNEEVKIILKFDLVDQTKVQSSSCHCAWCKRTDDLPLSV